MLEANQLELKDYQRAKQCLEEWLNQEGKDTFTQAKLEGGNITSWK